MRCILPLFALWSSMLFHQEINQCWIMLAVICKTGTEPMNIKIDRAPELRVLGYLEPRVHKLQIANVVINVLVWHIFQYGSFIYPCWSLSDPWHFLLYIALQAETKASPSSIVPSVKILALKANFGVFKEVNMLPSFLRCFPNIDTLHIEVTYMHSSRLSLAITSSIADIRMLGAWLICAWIPPWFCSLL